MIAFNDCSVCMIDHWLTKKLISNSPGLVDLAVGLVDFTLHLPWNCNGQVKVWGNFF